ncbi:DUF1178 family protein [Thalassococcus sp. BH17M4-6]|uniref:DUF1178 family protein n=1 Tax=Thalassococcus sp. BH17M4-6 TaxID=3413148 RepID=UPI003BEDFF6E
MISYSLRCRDDHRFDSWFQSADAFDKLRKSGMVTCAVCGSTEVEKAIMAPRVSTSEREARPLSGPRSPAEQAVAELRKKVESTADYVGKDFAKQARDMHDGISPERPIWGEARPDEARKLLQDGVPVLPLPGLPKRKTN